MISRSNLWGNLSDEILADVLGGSTPGSENVGKLDSARRSQVLSHFQKVYPSSIHPAF